MQKLTSESVRIIPRGRLKHPVSLNLASINMYKVKKRLSNASQIAYLPPLMGKYQSVSDNRFQSESGVLIEIQRFYSEKPNSAKYSIVRISPNGDKKRLSGLFPTSKPLVYSFDIKSTTGRKYYIIEFDKYYKSCEVKLV